MDAPARGFSVSIFLPAVQSVGGDPVFTQEKGSNVRRAVRRALLLSAVVMTAGQTSLVLDTGDSAPIDEVICTGSRLMRSRDLVAASPVQTIDVGTITDSGSITL